jgi:elongation factor G
MPKYTTEALRTIALVGHAGAGKTSLAEALLHKAGAITTPGTIERGSTVCDFDLLEKQHQHSLNSAVIHFDDQGTHVHLIDTPGYPDFMGQAIGALPAVETAAIVINAQNGIELITHRMMQWAEKRKLCRAIIVNKIDAENLDLPALLADIQEIFGKECLPINLPADGGKKVVDCFFNPSGDADFSSVAAAHNAIIDQTVEVDEELMAVYLDKGEVTPEQLHAPFEKALREGHLIPVCFVSARTGAGVAELFDIFAKLMPNPLEGNPPLFVTGEGEKEEEFHSDPDPKKHVLAHVFKVTVDPFVGKLGVFRVHQGTITKDSQLYIGHARKPFKVGHLFMLQGKEHVEVDAAIPGDIAAVAKIDEIEFDSVLHDSPEDEHIHLRPLEFPNPIYGIAIEPKKRGDEQRLHDILAKLSAEDPCFQVELSPSTNETILRGLGDLHMRTMLQRMAEVYKMEVATHPPRIAYRETVIGNAEGHHRHKKQTGGAGQFGEVFLRIEPLPRGTGFEFEDKTYGGSIPHQFIPAVEKGVRMVLDAGPLAGYPMQDVRVTVTDGKSHAVDSKEIAFVSAGKKAFLDAIEKARPIILEPIVNMQITIPDQHVGDITGDLSSRRGQITGTESARGNVSIIAGRVPLSEVSDYQSKLKSITGGAGSYALELSHYEAVPPQAQQKLIADYKATRPQAKDDD